MFTLVLSTLGAIIVSAVCSIAEAALLSLNPVRLETLKQQGKAYAATLLQMREQVDRPIAAVLILNTIANTGGAVVAGGAFDAVYGHQWLWLFTLIFALIILYVSEIIPKIVGVVFNERLAPWVAWFLVWSVKLLFPLIAITETIARAIRKGGATEERISAGDVQTIARMARLSNAIGSDQEQIITNAMKLRETTVQAVMIPREQIVFFRRGLAIEENIAIARQALHTRYPVSSTHDLDGIIGYVNFKELALVPEEERGPLEQYVRPLLNVRPEMPVSVLFQRLTNGRHHIAVVHGGDGRVTGLVTLEDVIEEVLGDIEDEFDRAPVAIIPLRAAAWKVGGGVTLGALRELCRIAPDGTPDTATVSAWLREYLGAHVRPRRNLALPGLRLTVLQVRRNEAQYVLLEHLEESIGGDEAMIHGERLLAHLLAHPVEPAVYRNGTAQHADERENSR
jgi:CBS domain containing-hemolysin-like protein